MKHFLFFFFCFIKFFGLLSWIFENDWLLFSSWLVYFHTVVYSVGWWWKGFFQYNAVTSVRQKSYWSLSAVVSVCALDACWWLVFIFSQDPNPKSWPLSGTSSPSVCLSRAAPHPHCKTMKFMSSTDTFCGFRPLCFSTDHRYSCITVVVLFNVEYFIENPCVPFSLSVWA